MLNNIKTLNLRLSGFKTIALLLIALNVISLACIYSSLHQGGVFVGSDTLLRQMIWIALSWLCLLLFSFINYRVYYNLSYIIYSFNILLLLGVSLFGKTVMGAQRWISIFGFTFQPSELSKIAIIIILAKFFSSKKESGFIKDFLLPLGLVGLNALIIFTQPDLGTALVLIFLFVSIGLFSKVNKFYFIGFVILGIVLTPFALGALKDYQRQRLTVFINPDVDPLGAGYTIIQSKIAIGSGQVLGKGFLAGTQNQFNFLPERHTDFIFTILTEEWGFLGAIFLLMLYWLILMKIIQKIGDSSDDFVYFFTLGISVLFFFHIFINIGMTLGILPVVGLPLIFLSYGGTNMLINYILLGIFLNICRNNH
jgi:rod shape determining protein RodA